MENASKALLLAGGVLIAMLVASLGVYFSRTISEQSARIYQAMEESEIAEFNRPFLNFDDRNDITIQDVVTMINFAKDSNKKNDLGYADDPREPLVVAPSDPLDDSSLYITIKSTYDDGSGKGIGGLEIDKCKNLERITNAEIDEAINKEMSKKLPVEFKCKVYINNKTGYVNYIEISV